jgi:type I restriction enzyme S subunit
MMFYKETHFQDAPIIGKVASDWDIVKLGDVLLLLRNGLTIRQSKEGNGYPVTRIETISEEYIDPNKVGYIQDLSESEINEYRLQNGDILFSHINSLDHIGKTAIYEGKPELLIHGMNLLLLRPDKEKIHPKFLLYLLRLYRVRNIFRAISKKAVNQASINQTELGRIKILLPPLEEQRAVAGVLGVVDSVIAKTDEVIAKTERLKKGLMQTLLTRGIGHKEFKETEIGKIPKTWQIVKFEELGAFQYGITTSAKKENTGIKLLRITDIKDEGTVDWEEVPYCDISSSEFYKYALKEGDILFARIGATTGKTCYVDRNIKAVFGSYLIRFKPETSDKINMKFLYYFTQSQMYWSQINRIKEGQLKKGLNTKTLAMLKVPVPPFLEQQKIAEILSAVDKKLEFERNEKVRLERIKRCLMDLLLTGKIRVKVD